MNDNKLKIFVVATIAAAITGTIALLCVPIVGFDGSMLQRVGAYIVASAFWLSVATELGLTILAARERKSLEKQYPSSAISTGTSGLLSFRKNREGFVADIALAVSLLVCVGLIIFRVRTGWPVIIIVSIMFLALSMHSILNGRNYRCLKVLRNHKKEHGKDE